MNRHFNCLNESYDTYLQNFITPTVALKMSRYVFVVDSGYCGSSFSDVLASGCSSFYLVAKIKQH